MMKTKMIFLSTNAATAIGPNRSISRLQAEEDAGTQNQETISNPIAPHLSEEEEPVAVDIAMKVAVVNYRWNPLLMTTITCPFWTMKTKD